MARKLNLSVLFVLFLFFLTSCEKLFNLEGTIYLKEGERIQRLSGTKIYLLNNGIEKIISGNLDEYKKESKAAIKAYEKKILQREIVSKKVALKETISQIEKNKFSVTESKKLSADNLKKYVSSKKKTTDAELKIEKEDLKTKLEIINSKKELEILNSLLEVKKRRLSSILMKRRKELSNLSKKKNSNLAESKKSYAKKMNEFKGRILAIRTEIANLRASYEKNKKSLVSKYFWDYVQNNILIVNKLNKPCRSCTPQLSFFIENKGNKAIRAMEFDLYYKNISLRNSGFKISEFGAYGLDRIWHPQRTNKYRETVHGIAPKKRMLRSKSFYLRGRSRMQGDMLRFFEKMGGYDPSKFKVVIKKAYLSDPATFHSYNPYSSRYMRSRGIKRWRYKKQSSADVFKKEINNSKLLKNTKQKIKKVLAKQIKLTKEIMQIKSTFSAEKKNISVIYSSFLKKKRKQILKAEKDVLTYQLTKQQKKKMKELEKNISKMQLLMNSSRFKLKQMKENVESLRKKKSLYRGLLEVAKNRLVSSMSKKKKIESQLKNLKDNKGVVFTEIQKYALNNTPLLEMQSLWINKFVDSLISSKTHLGNSDIDGKFRFEKITKETTYIFAVANHHKKRFMWFIELDLASKNKQDLSDINNTVLDVRKLNSLFEYFNKAISVKSEDVATKDIVPSK